MSFVIRAVGVQTYWLRRVGKTNQYCWRTGAAGRTAAYRFDTQVEAEAVATRVNGAGGAAPEVIEIKEGS